MKFFYLLFSLYLSIYCDCYKIKDKTSPNLLREFSVDLSQYKDEQLYGRLSLNIGGQKDDFERNVIFDTGSNFLWVQGRGDTTQMFNCKSAEDCKKKLMQKKNLIIRGNFVYFIKYKTGSVAIEKTSARMKLCNDFYLNDFNLGLSVFEEKDVFYQMKFNGIFGLSFSSNSKDVNNFQSFLDILLLNKSLKENIFSFYLGGANTKKNFLTFGSIPPQIINTTAPYSFHFADLHPLHKSLWKIEIDSLNIKDFNVCELLKPNKCFIVIDSGTSFYSVPKRIYSKIKEQTGFDTLCINYDRVSELRIKMKESKYSKYSEYSSNLFFNLTLSNQDFITKKAVELNIEENNETIKLNKCELDFNTNDFEDVIILGLKFMRKYYTIFDFERKIVGFTQYGEKENYGNKNYSYRDLVRDKEIDTLINDWKKVYGKESLEQK